MSTPASQPVREQPWTDQMRPKRNQAEVEVIISNRQGLHARPVMRFVDLAGTFQSSIRVRADREEVDGKSPMEMMLLAATQGTPLKIMAQGEDAEAAVAALAGLIQDKFGEE